MASNLELAENYLQKREEIDDLSNEKVLLVIAYLQKRDYPNSKELAEQVISNVEETSAAWIELQRASNQNLLEIYRQNREEIDVLADEKLLFVLNFLQQLDNATLKDLTDHLGWKLEDIRSDCVKLQDAGLIRIEDTDNPDAQIELSQRGEGLLKLFLSASVSKRIEASSKSSEGVKPKESEGALINELAKKAAGGNKEALRELFEHSYFRRRLKTICVWLAKRHRLDPSELENEAYQKILMNINKFEAKASFETWFSTVIKRLHIDMLRKQIRQDRYVKGQEEALRDEGFTENVVEKNMIIRIALKETISKLSARDRRILELSLEGYHIKEIGMRVGLSPSHTHRKLEKVLMKLQDVVSSAS